MNDFVSTPKFQFQAMPPAQMHGDTTGGVEWFVSTDGTNAGGNTIRVTEMTNYLSSSPTFTYTSLPVTPYQNAPQADQPGGSWTTFPNTTTTQVLYRNGHLVTAMASAIGTDGFTYPKGLYYQVDVSSGTPVLLQQGVIDPGPGVAVQMPTVAEDDKGNLGFTWMEGSSTEFVSMWVGTLDAITSTFSSFDAAPGWRLLCTKLPDRRLQHASWSTRPTARPSGPPTSTSGLTATPTSGERTSRRSRCPRR